MARAYAVSKPPTNITTATIAPTTTKNITNESHFNAAFRSMSNANIALRASICNRVARVAFQAAQSVGTLENTANTAIGTKLFSCRWDSEANIIRKLVAAPKMHSPNPTTHNRQDSLRKSVRSSDVNRSEERRVGKECRSRWSPEH